MKLTMIRAAATLGALCALAVGAPIHAQDDSSLAPVDPQAADAMTDSERDVSQTADVADAAGPIAFGVVYFNGTKQSGTTNWTSSYNSTYKRYEIKISGESYFYTKYSTIITPAGDVRFCRSSSVSGKLLVYCHNSNGATQTARFGFVTFKQ